MRSSNRGGRGRWPFGGWVARLLAEGDNPDPRFTLANERTFLAWIRTSLAVIAAGIGVALTGGLMPAPLRIGFAAVLSAGGALLAAAAFHRWLSTERALRRAETLPPPRLAPLISYGLAAVTIILLAGLLVTR
jgi:putative membrane protein